MKKNKLIYWTLTVLVAIQMLSASICDLIPIPEAVKGFQELGYPVYLLPFLGVARILGLIAIFTPGFHRLKEWAYAGFVFDLVGAIYSGIANGDPLAYQTLPFVSLLMVIGSYVFYHKLRKQAASRETKALSATTVLRPSFG